MRVPEAVLVERVQAHVRIGWHCRPWTKMMLSVEVA